MKTSPDTAPAEAGKSRFGMLVAASRLEKRCSFAPTGLAELDRRLGGFVRGGVNELVSPRGGAEALLYALLASATARGEGAALVDAADGFDLESAQTLGLAPQLLLWLRPKRPEDAAAAAERLLRLQGLKLVILALAEPAQARRLAKAVFWLRLKRAAACGEAAFLVSSPFALAGSFCSLRLRLCQWQGLWRKDSPPWLQGVELFLRLERAPAGACAAWRMRLAA